LALHSAVDGLAVAASIHADAEHGHATMLLGFGTFLAVLLHKPLDAVSVTSLMTAGGWTTGWRHAVNAGFALMCPLGAMLFFLGIERFAEYQHALVGCALAFSAGVFLCISLSDLLPELEMHSHDRVKLSFALLLGIAIAYGIGYLEPAHLHSHGATQGEHGHSHEHHHD
jgi:zinc and cadmium transporter